MPKTKRTALYEAGKDNKTPVMGMVQQDGKAKLFVIGNAPFKYHVRQNVATKAVIVTDEHLGYQGLVNEYKSHVTVNHSNYEYKTGIYHTNTVEGFS